MVYLSPLAISPSLGLQVHTTMPGFLGGPWGSKLANALAPPTPSPLLSPLPSPGLSFFAVWLWYLSSLEMAPLTLLPHSWMVSLVHDGFELDETECHLCEADLHVSVPGNTLTDLR